MSIESFILMYRFHFVNVDNLYEVHLVFIIECGLHYKNLYDFLSKQALRRYKYQLVH
jgi:hypothetical protein